MKTPEIIAAVRAIGREMTARDGQLVVSAGNVALTPELRQAIKENRDALLVLLTPPPPEPEPAPVPPKDETPATLRRIRRCHYRRHPAAGRH